MKKIFFYLFALISAIGLFTACSSDDDETWKQIPQTEITAGDATLVVNGETFSTGSVQMMVKNGSDAVLTLKDVIPGYKKVTIDVALQQQADNSFLFAGNTGLSDPPSMLGTRSTAKEVIFDLSVLGNITVDGKIAVTTTTELTAAAQGGLAGSWKLGDFTMDMENFVLLASPAYVKWQATENSAYTASTISNMVSLMTSSLLAEYLNEVTFNTDGNITAKYGDKLPPVKDFGELTVLEWMINTPNITEDMTIVPLNNTWTGSPKNLAFWYVKGGLLYVVPNIKNIMAQAGADQEGEEIGSLDMVTILQMLGEMGIDISDPNVQALLPQVMGWMSTGIPLRYDISDDGKLNIYVDQDMTDPFMKVINGLLPALDEKIPDEYAGMLQFVLGISKLSDLSKVWDDTTDFNLGIGLKK